MLFSLSATAWFYFILKYLSMVNGEGVENPSFKYCSILHPRITLLHSDGPVRVSLDFSALDVGSLFCFQLEHRYALWIKLVFRSSTICEYCLISGHFRDVPAISVTPQHTIYQQLLGTLWCTNQMIATVYSSLAGGWQSNLNDINIWDKCMHLASPLFHYCGFATRRDARVPKNSKPLELW